MNGRHVGTWRQTRGEQDEFIYARSWLDDSQFRPLSLSLPVTATREIRAPEVRNYFDNLLPDSQRIRERLRIKHGAPSTQTFDLLEAIGRDCVGAVQLMPQGTPPTGWDRLTSTPLRARDVETLLRTVPTTQMPLVAGSEGEQEFRISIAGAQEKTALLKIGSTWHLPTASTPTTHILKLPLGTVGGGLQLDLSDSVDNEWLCCALLEALKLPVASTQIGRFGDQRVLIVERFDRAWQGLSTTHDPDAAKFKPPAKAWIARLPQEDFCQATGRASDLKYEKDGGPGIAEILSILSTGGQPEQDTYSFARSQLLFWLLAATDGHAKNFSLFQRRDGNRLTPVYDVLSAWPVMGNKARQLPPQKVRMAMALRTGTRPHYKWDEIQPRHFKTLADQLPAPDAWAGMMATAQAVPEAIARVEKRLPPDFKEAVWNTITQGVARKAKDFLREAGTL